MRIIVIALTHRGPRQRGLRFWQKFDRPVLCTEWLARHVGSVFEEQLPLFSAFNAGCYQWGLVRGKTQTTLPTWRASHSVHNTGRSNFCQKRNACKSFGVAT